MAERGVRLAVIGGASCSAEHHELALKAGRLIAQAGAVLLCGGRGGIMSAAAEGAQSAGGTTVGILPGSDDTQTPANPHIELPIFTGLGQARNQVLVLSAAAVIGIGGGWGTLSEIGLALRHRVPVVLLSSWRLTRPDGEGESRLYQATDAHQAVELALQAARKRGSV